MANKVMLSGEFGQNRVRVGDLFQVVEDGEVYIFSRVSRNKFTFISLSDGNRWNDSFELNVDDGFREDGMDVREAVERFTDEGVEVRWLGSCEILVKRC